MEFLKATLIAAILVPVIPNWASAQGVTPQNVTDAFSYGVTACAKAVVSSTSVAVLPQADRLNLRETEATAQVMSRPTPGRPMFGVDPAVGIVEISEPDATTCKVIGYGPRVLPTFAATKARLTAAFPAARETKTARTPDDIIAEYEVASASGQKVAISLVGGEPGMGSRRFRFPMFTADVTLAGGATPSTAGAALASAPAIAPAPKPTQELTSASVTAAFAYGVALCAKSLASGGGIDTLPTSDRADVMRADPATSEFARARPDDKLYDVLSAKDIIVINDGGGLQCNVAGSGPRVAQIVQAVKQELIAQSPNLSERPIRQRQGIFVGSFTLPQSNGASINVAIAGREWGVKARNTLWSAFSARLTRMPSQ